MQGWIKLHRELIEKIIWLESTPEQKVILITLLTLANHQEKEWEWQGKRYKAKPGEFVTSLSKIAEKSGKGITIQNVRTALVRFEKYEFLTNTSTKQNRLIKIVNWGVYQDSAEETNNQANSQLTVSQQRANSQLTTNKNVKNEKNDKEIKDSPPKPPKRIYEDDSIYLKLAQQLFDNILANNPEAKKPNLQIWADDFRKLIELDKRSEEQAINMIAWSQSNSFWQGVILSAKKLRDKYDQMKVQATRDYNSQKGGYNQQSNRKETLPDWAKEEQQQVEEKPMSDEDQAAFKERIKRIQESGRTD